MLRGRRRYGILLVGLILSLSVLGMSRMDVQAVSRKEYLDTLNAGITKIMDPSSGSTDEEAIQELAEMSQAGGARREKESDLVMVNVQVAMNVRAEADEKSDKVGLLYKDCGGRILERKDGWTRLRSGDLVGWANDEYLLFGEEAEELADEVGNLIVLIKTEALCVREEPDVNAQAMGFIPEDEELEIIETLDDDWISVKYDEKVGYVSAEYVDIDFHIDEGLSLIHI